jgi:hypothetical protein
LNGNIEVVCGDSPLNFNYFPCVHHRFFSNKIFKFFIHLQDSHLLLLLLDSELLIPFYRISLGEFLESFSLFLFLLDFFKFYWFFALHQRLLVVLFSINSCEHIWENLKRFDVLRMSFVFLLRNGMSFKITFVESPRILVKSSKLL